MTTEKAKGIAREIQGERPVVIEVIEHGSGSFEAQLSGHAHSAHAWAFGKTVDDAIGLLVRLHGDKLGISVKCDPTQLR